MDRSKINLNIDEPVKLKHGFKGNQNNPITDNQAKIANKVKPPYENELNKYITPRLLIKGLSSATKSTTKSAKIYTAPRGGRKTRKHHKKFNKTNKSVRRPKNRSLRHR